MLPQDMLKYGWLDSDRKLPKWTMLIELIGLEIEEGVRDGCHTKIAENPRQAVLLYFFFVLCVTS